MVAVLAALAAASILLLFCWLVLQATRRDAHVPWLRNTPDPEYTDVPDYGTPSYKLWSLSLAIVDQKRQLREAESEARQLRPTQRDLESAARASLRAAQREVRTCKTALNGLGPWWKRWRQSADLQEAVDLERSAQKALQRASSMSPLEPSMELVAHLAEQEVRMWRKAVKGSTWWEEAELGKTWWEAKQRRDSLVRASAAQRTVEKYRVTLLEAINQKNAQVIAMSLPAQPEKTDSSRRRDSVPALLRILAVALPREERQGQSDEWRADLSGLSRQGRWQWRRWRYAIAAAGTVPRLAARRFQRTGTRLW